MDLTALPTQSFSRDNTDHPSSDDSLVSPEGSTESAVQKPIDPNTIVIADALTDSHIRWQIHNCKISKKTLTQDLPLPFLYHYDSLSDTLKAAHPLTPPLLAQFNTLMTPAQAAQHLGIDTDLIAAPWHVKVTGSLVVFSEALQLAVRLHWTNTGKQTQPIYTKASEDALMAAFEDWQFFGRIDVLYKNDKQTLVSLEDAPTADSGLLTIDPSTDYQQLPASHALAVIAKLEADKKELPWFETAILARLE